MDNALALGDFVVLCKKTADIDTLWQRALDFFHGHGIAMVSYHIADAAHYGGAHLGIVEDGFPEDWVCHYMDAKLYLVDPIPALASMRTQPFWWSETANLSNLSDEQAAYMEELSASELGDGLALQVYGPKTRDAYVGLGFGTKRPKLSKEQIFQLQCAAQVAHIRYCELTEEIHLNAPRLAPRELEVLRWIARGKSNSVIADIMGISRYTVDTMTRRMFEKLKVNDRTTAAIRGLGAGLLHRNGDSVV